MDRQGTNFVTAKQFKAIVHAFERLWYEGQSSKSFGNAVHELTAMVEVKRKPARKQKKEKR